MGKWDGLNRRQFPRVNYPCLVIIKDGGDNSDNILLTHTENVGVGGVSVTLKQNVKMFSAVDLELDLLDWEEHIKCKGKVVWGVRRNEEEKTKPSFYDIGIEFQNLSAKSQQRIKAIVERIAQAKEKEQPSKKA